MSRGQLTIIGIFGLSLLAVAGSLAWRYHETRQVLDFWGAEAATLIAQAGQVEARKLEPRSDAGAGPDHGTVMQIDGRPHTIVQSRDVSNAPGFTNARHALTLNHSFRWNYGTGCEPTWSYALQFCQGEQCAVVLIDPNCRLVGLLDGDKTAVLTSPIADGLAIVLEEQFRDGGASQTSTTNTLENRKGTHQ